MLVSTVHNVWQFGVPHELRFIMEVDAVCCASCSVLRCWQCDSSTAACITFLIVFLSLIGSTQHTPPY